MADGEQAVVAQDDGLAVAELVRDPLALLEVEHDAGVLVEQRVVVVERARVLGDRIEQSAERGPRLAVYRMGVGGADHVGPRGVHLRVDGERGLVQRSVALDDRAVVAHQHQVADADVAEVHAERIDPEVIGQLRVARGDVPRDALVEAEAAEQAERRRQVLFAVQPLFLDRAALLREERCDVAACEFACLFDVVRQSWAEATRRNRSAGGVLQYLPELVIGIAVAGVQPQLTRLSLGISRADRGRRCRRWWRRGRRRRAVAVAGCRVRPAWPAAAEPCHF